MIGVITATGGNTFFGRTAKLVQSAGATSHFQAAVMRIGDFLIVSAAVLAVILVGAQITRGADFLRLAEFVLILAIVATQVFAALMAAYGWLVPALPWTLVGLVWGYNLAWMVIQDVAKLGLYRELNARRMGTTLLETRMRTSLTEFGDLHRPAGPRSVASRT